MREKAPRLKEEMGGEERNGMGWDGMPGDDGMGWGWEMSGGRK